MLDYTGERAIPWNSAVGADVLIPHIQRYAFALRYCWQKAVVDLACGTGYGSYMLSMVSKTVKGVDIAPDAVTFALDHFRASNLEYGQDDITKAVPFGEVYTAFECLEHLDNPQETLSLLTGSILIYSIPVDDGSRFHARAYTVDEIIETFGGEIFFQDVYGTIVPREVAWFEPEYILGVHEL